ncbi:hypothetical protein Hypma_000652 [Hypsizygus marmoreus]|uniref:Uncharacterized protein n=1 Tax=Hypsizygus marmoreus TaxID=39966 RepID=A0A369J9Z3_HYPMA|nr:hypothetical protein Hypma_000652 [Hypsizygus marmoreus]
MANLPGQKHDFLERSDAQVGSNIIAIFTYANLHSQALAGNVGGPILQAALSSAPESEAFEPFVHHFHNAAPLAQDALHEIHRGFQSTLATTLPPLPGPPQAAYVEVFSETYMNSVTAPRPVFFPLQMGITEQTMRGRPPAVAQWFNRLDASLREVLQLCFPGITAANPEYQVTAFRGLNRASPPRTTPTTAAAYATISATLLSLCPQWLDAILAAINNMVHSFWLLPFDDMAVGFFNSFFRLAVRGYLSMATVALGIPLLHDFRTGLPHQVGGATGPTLGSPSEPAEIIYEKMLYQFRRITKTIKDALKNEIFNDLQSGTYTLVGHSIEQTIEEILAAISAGTFDRFRSQLIVDGVATPFSGLASISTIQRHALNIFVIDSIVRSWIGLSLVNGFRLPPVLHGVTQHWTRIAVIEAVKDLPIVTCLVGPTKKAYIAKLNGFVTLDILRDSFKRDMRLAHASRQGSMRDASLQLDEALVRGVASDLRHSPEARRSAGIYRTADSVSVQRYTAGPLFGFFSATPSFHRFDATDGVPAVLEARSLTYFCQHDANRHISIQGGFAVGTEVPL